MRLTRSNRCNSCIGSAHTQAGRAMPLHGRLLFAALRTWMWKQSREYVHGCVLVISCGEGKREARVPRMSHAGPLFSRPHSAKILVFRYR
jgi:AhpD family alkylhydroperoxidase